VVHRPQIQHISNNDLTTTMQTYKGVDDLASRGTIKEEHYQSLLGITIL